MAKAADLSQDKFNKTLYAMAEQQKQYQTQLEDKKKTLGNKLNVLQDYITKNYAAPVHTIVLSTLIGDENAMTEALKHHSQVPA